MDMFYLLQDTTCESALHLAARLGSYLFIDILLNYDPSAVKCINFQGLTSIGSAVVFYDKHHQLPLLRLATVSSQNLHVNRLPYVLECLSYAI